ncbi:MAG: hypothetical protein V1790_17390 [Planctomycetota bacterium]
MSTLARDQITHLEKQITALIAALENLLDSLPSEAVSRYVRLDDHDEDEGTAVYTEPYYAALVELRKHRPWPLTGRCALCNNAGSLMVEGRRRGPVVSMSCPNCAANKPPCPTCGGTRRVPSGPRSRNLDRVCPDCAGGEKGN